ncbi:MAG: ScpA family protein [Pseudomonadota bacterium]
MKTLEQKKADLSLMAEALNKVGALGEDEKFHVALEDFEGPLDILLVMAKNQKVDLMQLSISAIADQYLKFIKIAQSLRLELAADYLVMAAWLAFLKSKLLLPTEEDEEEELSAEALAAQLSFQLARLNAMREKTQMLLNLPRLGQGFFARGMPEPLMTQKETVWKDTLYDLLMAYGARKMMQARQTYHVNPPDVIRPEDVLKRLLPMVGQITQWSNLKNFLPVIDDQEAVIVKSAYAGTLVACLELAKRGLVEIKQDELYGEIDIKALNADTTD